MCAREGMLHMHVHVRVSAYQCLCVCECLWKAEAVCMLHLSQLFFDLFTHLFTYFDIKFLTALTAHRLQLANETWACPGLQPPPLAGFRGTRSYV